jgi:hypothetical protein
MIIYIKPRRHIVFMNNIILYEELSMNAHPSIKTQVFDGWVLRFANGYTNRANSVNPLYSSEIAIEEKINQCEKIYKSQGLATVFKLTPLSINLDKPLEEKGYVKVTPTNIMTTSLAESKTFSGKSVVTDKITEEWQEKCFKLIGISDDLTMSKSKAIKGNIINKTLCALIIENGVVIACGLCVVEREYAGLFDIEVDVNYRRKGLGFDICNSLLSNAVKIGAKQAYLQVVADNTPAVALYNKMGFTDCYQYWYRVKK